MKYSKSLFLLLLMCAYSRTEDTAGFFLSGRITGYKPGKTIFISVYDSQEAFKTTKFLKGTHFDGETLPADSVRYRFDSLPAGVYMVAAFQDINGDKTLNLGFLGRPVEPYGFFRPFTGMFVPSYNACRFRFESDFNDADIEF